MQTSNEGPVKGQLNSGSSHSVTARPAVTHRLASGLEVINGLRDHRIPFGAVEDIEVRYTTVIWASGKKYVSWGAPNLPTAFGSGFHHVSDLKSRPFGGLPSNERISQPGTKTGRDAIVAAWHDARFSGSASADGDVVSAWNMPTVVVGAFAVLSVIVAAWV